MFITIACIIIVCAFIGRMFCVRRRRRRRARKYIYGLSIEVSVRWRVHRDLQNWIIFYFPSTVVILTLFAATMLWVLSAIDGTVLELNNLFFNKTVNQPAIRQREPYNLRPRRNIRPPQRYGDRRMWLSLKMIHI